MEITAPRDLSHGQKPAELRDIIRRPTACPLPENTFDAVMDLLDYPEPVSLERVREELDVLGEGFIYFTDERKVLYVRQDGDYGLVEPPPVVPAAS